MKNPRDLKIVARTSPAGWPFVPASYDPIWCFECHTFWSDDMQPRVCAECGKSFCPHHIDCHDCRPFREEGRNAAEIRRGFLCRQFTGDEKMTRDSQWFYWSISCRDWMPITAAEAAVKSDVFVILLADQRPARFPPIILREFYRKLNLAFGI